MTESQNTPLAAQLLKRAQRLSIAGASRSSQGLRQSGLFEPSKRRSTLLSTPAQNRRVSLHGSGGSQIASQAGTVPSYAGSIGVPSTPYSSQTSVPSYPSNTYPPSSSRKADPRPLRDKNYQSLISKEIYDFCIANRFELDMNHTVSMKTLRQPTQKDFILLFQFLYGKIDPNHKFSRSVESEVFVLLKILNYPYLDGINRSSISAVGGQNWPSFLGMLYWLVNLNLTLSNLDTEALIAPDDIFDHIFIKYIFSSYTSFIEQEENYSVYYDEMKREFDRAVSRLDAQAQEVSRSQEHLSEEFERLSKKYSELEEAEAKSRALENDLQQFSEYMSKMKERQSQWSHILVQMQTEINNAEHQLQELENQKKSYESLIEEKGYSIQDIDKLNMERDKLSKSIDIVTNKIEDLRESLMKNDNEILQSYQSLESFVNQYNLMVSRIPSEYNDEYALQLNPALLEESAEVESDAILNKQLKDEKIKLLSQRSKLNQEILDVQEDSIKIIEQVDQCSEKIFEQQEEIEALEAQVTKNKATQEDIYETMVSEGSSYSAQIEKLDRDLQSMQINANRGIIEAETRNKNLKIQHHEMQYTVKEKREQLHETVHSLLQYVILFKLNIQENFEELERQAIKELETERQN